MHFTLFLIALFLAVILRFLPLSDGHQQSWQTLWQISLSRFLISPLLLLTTAIAILTMGMHGAMWGWSVGWIGCHLALGFLAIAATSLIVKSIQAWRSLQALQQYSKIELNGISAYCLETSALFAAQVGFWTPQLILSRGLLDTLSAEQLQAVLTHEQAHLHFRDTFWFFWLEWLRQLTAALPQTEQFWQSLLFLREVRADRWAAERVDPLLLAEALLAVVRSPLRSPPALNHWNYAAFEQAAFEPVSEIGDRLEARIDALLREPEPEEKRGDHWTDWLTVGLAIAPLAMIWFHC